MDGQVEKPKVKKVYRRKNGQRRRRKKSVRKKKNLLPTPLGGRKILNELIATEIDKAYAMVNKQKRGDMGGEYPSHPLQRKNDQQPAERHEPITR